MARVNRRVSNKLIIPIAPLLPGFGVVTHRGRRTGQVFRTPVSVFPRAGGVVFALIYGKDSDWTKNVMAAGSCELHTRGGTTRLVNPRLVHDETRAGIRPVERAVLRVLSVADFLVLDTAGRETETAEPGTETAGPGTDTA
jgi:deazaflavin-dependent oxidoreductase (nitroreductase family)